jgi:hypothetical protein
MSDSTLGALKKEQDRSICLLGPHELEKALGFYHEYPAVGKMATALRHAAEEFVGEGGPRWPRPPAG